MKILIILFTIFYLSVKSYADVNVSGSIKYTSPTKTTIESPTEPANPNTNDLWHNPETGVIKKWTGIEWKNIKSTSELTKDKSGLKSEISQISDAHAKKALEILSNIVLENCGGDKL